MEILRSIVHQFTALETGQLCLCVNTVRALSDHKYYSLLIFTNLLLHSCWLLICFPQIALHTNTGSVIFLFEFVSLTIFYTSKLTLQVLTTQQEMTVKLTFQSLLEHFYSDKLHAVKLLLLPQICIFLHKIAHTSSIINIQTE